MNKIEASLHFEQFNFPVEKRRTAFKDDNTTNYSHLQITFLIPHGLNYFTLFYMQRQTNEKLTMNREI